MTGDTDPDDEKTARRNNIIVLTLLILLALALVIVGTAHVIDSLHSEQRSAPTSHTLSSAPLPGSTAQVTS
jgi:hypothetical protein